MTFTEYAKEHGWIVHTDLWGETVMGKWDGSHLSCLTLPDDSPREEIWGFLIESGEHARVRLLAESGMSLS